MKAYFGMKSSLERGANTWRTSALVSHLVLPKTLLEQEFNFYCGQTSRFWGFLLPQHDLAYPD